MVDPDKKIARPVGSEPPGPEPWSQRDAKLMHGVGLGFRLFVGFIAALIGGLMLFILYGGAHKVGARGTYGQDSPYSFLLVAVLGGLFTAFAIGQVLQLAWVGGDQGFDERLWVRMTSRERGLWRLREGSSGRWTFRLFIAITLAGLLYVDAKLGRMLGQEALAGRWLPAAASFMLTLAFAGLAFLAFRGRSLRSSAAPDSTWVSQGRWVIKGSWPTPGGALFILVVSMPFLAAALWLEPRRWDVYGTYMYWAAGLFFLIGGLWELRTALRSRSYGRPELEVIREVDRPLVLKCTATLPFSPGQAARGTWRAKFQACRVTGYYSRWFWLETAARVTVAPGTRRGSFTLRINMPTSVPYPMSTWTILLESSLRRSEPLEFLLSEEIVFPEEYPAE